MSEEVTKTDNGDEEVETPPEGTETEENVDELPGWARKALTKANNEAATYRTRVRELEPLEAAKVAAEAAAKTETQKAVERAEAAEQRALALEAAALRSTVGAAKGLTPAQAGRLQGSTQEELEADADALLEAFTPAAAEPVEGIPSRQIKPNLRSGREPTVEVQETDPAKLAVKRRYSF